jgi:hypothetical protein
MNGMKGKEGTMENNIEIIIMSDVETVRENLGYDEFEPVGQDLIEFQQGIDIDTVEIEDDGTFEIPEGYHGQIQSDTEYYELITFDDSFEEREPIGWLNPGRYQIKDDTIKKIDDRDRRFYY